jgi:AraC family transcriptional regulator
MSIVSMEIVRYEFDEPVDGVVEEDDHHRLDLCLTPRPYGACGSFQHWPRSRYERLGNLFLVPAGHQVRARSDSGRQMSAVCRLRRSAIREWGGYDLDWTEPQLIAGLDITSPAIRGLLHRMGQETRAPGFASTMMIELMAGQLAIELVRFHAEVADQPPVRGLAPWRLKRIDERVHEDRAQPTLTELAELCGLSTRQLTRGFRVSQNMSIGDFVTSVRVERAKRLLANAQSIKEVAYAIGFGSPSSFSYAFRRATGETPQNFRQQIGRPVCKGLQ